MVAVFLFFKVKCCPIYYYVKKTIISFIITFSEFINKFNPRQFLFFHHQHEAVLANFTQKYYRNSATRFDGTFFFRRISQTAAATELSVSRESRVFHLLSFDIKTISIGRIFPPSKLLSNQNSCNIRNQNRALIIVPVWTGAFCMQGRVTSGMCVWYWFQCFIYGIRFWLPFIAKYDTLPYNTL